MRVQRLREALASLQPTFDAGRWKVEAHAELAIQVVPRGFDDVDVRITMPLSDTIDAMRIVQAAHALSESGRIETGDAELDALAFVFTSEIATIGALSKHVRRLLVALLRRGATFTASEIALEPWATEALAAEREPASAIAGAVQDMVRVAQALTVPKGQAPFVRIGKIAQDDPDLEVRLAFARIAQRFPEVQNANHRLIAKRAIVADDDTFEALTRVVADAKASNQVLRESWTKLLKLFPISRVAPLFDDASKPVADMLIGLTITRAKELGEDELGPIGHALMKLIDRRGGKPEVSAGINAAQFFQRALFTPAIDWLAKCLDRRESNELPRAALGALLAMPVPPEETYDVMTEKAQGYAVEEGGSVGHLLAMRNEKLGPLIGRLFEKVQWIHPVGEYLLAFKVSGEPAYADAVVPYLESDNDLVRDAAVETLGEIGARRHVRALTPFTKGLFRSNALKEKALVAIEKIELRAPPDSEGGLALAEGGDGALALTEGEHER